jgi:hypothetical protein
MEQLGPRLGSLHRQRNLSPVVCVSALQLNASVQRGANDLYHD